MGESAFEVQFATADRRSPIALLRRGRGTAAHRGRSHRRREARQAGHARHPCYAAHLGDTEGPKPLRNGASCDALERSEFCAAIIGRPPACHLCIHTRQHNATRRAPLFLGIRSEMAGPIVAVVFDLDGLLLDTGVMSFVSF